MSAWGQFLWSILLLKEKTSLLHMLKIQCIVLSAITNRYPQFSIVTLRSISMKNLLTAGGNLYNSFVILTNLQNFQKNFFSWKTSGGCFWKAKSRSSHLEVFRKKGVPRNFTNFTGKHLRWSLFCTALGLQLY